MSGRVLTGIARTASLQYAPHNSVLCHHEAGPSGFETDGKTVLFDDDTDDPKILRKGLDGNAG